MEIEKYFFEPPDGVSFSGPNQKGKLDSTGPILYNEQTKQERRSDHDGI